MEGQKGTVTLMLDRSGDGVPPDEKITVELKHAASSTASPQDYRLEKTKVEFSATAKTGTFVIDVLDDQDVGGESLVLMAVVSGEDDNGEETKEVMLDAIMLDDTTAKMVEPKADAVVDAAVMTARTAGDANKDGLWTASESLKLMEDQLFTYDAMTTNVVLGNIQVDNTDVVSASTTNDYLMVTAKSDGTAMITVTATATSKASSAIPQTVSNVAQVAFEVMVDAPAITAMSQTAVNAAVAAAIKKAADMAASKQWEPGGATAMVPLAELFAVPESIRAIFDATSSDVTPLTQPADIILSQRHDLAARLGQVLRPAPSGVACGDTRQRVDPTRARQVSGDDGFALARRDQQAARNSRGARRGSGRSRSRGLAKRARLQAARRRVDQPSEPLVRLYDLRRGQFD